MANNINKVWELMGINPETGTGTYKNRMGLGNAITRDNGIPLDLSSLHATYNDAVVYAATSSIAYVDQVVAAEGVVYIITAESQGKVTIDTYKDSITGKIIEGEAKEYDVFLKPVGTIPGFDEAENGTLPQIQIGDDGKRTLTWVPISAIVEGDGNTVTEVKGATNDSHVTVTPEYDQTNDKYTYTISVNVEDKADAEQVADDIAAAKEEVEGSISSAVQTLEGQISDAKSELEGDISDLEDKFDGIIGVEAEGETPASGLYAAIAEAEQRAKDYADANDTDTVYNDEEVRGLISGLDSRVGTAEGKIEDIEDVISGDENGLIKQITDLGTAISAETERATAAEEKALTDAKAYTDEEIEGLSVAIEQKEGVEYIIVKNKAGEEVASANASKFVQDSFLNDVSYDPETRKVSFTWSMGDGSTKTDEIEIGDLVDTYTAGTGLTLNGNEFGVNTDVIATKDDIDDINEVLATKFDSTQVDAAIDAKLVAVNTAIGTKADAEETTAALALKANAADVATTVEGLEATIAEKAVKSDVETALATKVDKDTYATDKSTFATKTELQTVEENAGEAVNALADAVYTKTAADAKFDTIENVAATYATKEALGEVATTANNSAAKVTNLEDKIKEITEVGGEPNSIEYIKVNGEIQTPDAEKAVNIAVPVMSDVKVSDLKDGGAALQDIADLKTGVAGNADNITLINQKLNAEQLGLAALNTRLSSLETEVGVVESSRIDALEGVVGNAEAGLVKIVAGHTADLITLNTKDAELTAAIEANGKLIAANTAKFADYRTVADSYSKAEVEELIDGVVGQIDYSPYALKTDVANTVAELTTAINGKADAKATEDALALKANAADVYTKTEADAAFMTQDEVDSRINALIVGADPEGGKTIENIQNLVKYVDENAGDIAELITTVGNNTTAIENAVAAIGENKTAIEDLQDNVTAGLADVTVHSSTEIEVAARTGENVTGVELSIKEVNVNKLVQTTGDVLILNGGSATV